MVCEKGSEKMDTQGGYGIGILDEWWLGAGEEPKRDDEAWSVQPTITGRSSFLSLQNLTSKPPVAPFKNHLNHLTLHLTRPQLLRVESGRIFSKVQHRRRLVTIHQNGAGSLL